MAADTKLQWNFNIRPLISDIMGIYNALSAHEKRLNDLIARVGKPQLRHFAYRWDEFKDNKTVYESETHYMYRVGDGIPSGFVQHTQATIDRFVSHSPSVFHCQIEYNYNFTQYQLEHARILSLLDAFGVNLNPAIIWNAIPWSFVVDWLVGVGRYLDQWKISNMKPTINIRRSLWSVKRERTVHTAVRLTHSAPYSAYNNMGKQQPVVTETAYLRRVDLPTEASLITSGLTPGEFSLGAALVVSQRRRPKGKLGVNLPTTRAR